MCGCESSNQVVGICKFISKIGKKSGKKKRKKKITEIESLGYGLFGLPLRLVLASVYVHGFSSFPVYFFSKSEYMQSWSYGT